MSGSTHPVSGKPGADTPVDAYLDALLGPCAPQIAAPAAPKENPRDEAPAQSAAASDTGDTGDAVDMTATQPSEAEPAAGDAAGMPVDFDIEAELLAEFDAEMASKAGPIAAEPPHAPAAAAAPPPVADDDIAALLAEFDAEMAAKAVPAPPTPAPAAPQSARSAAPARPLPAAAETVDPEPAPTPASAPAGRRWLRVATGEDRYAVELLRVQEVVRLAPMIAVRGAAPSLLGVMNLRGRVVPVHDLGRWLRRSAIEIDERSRIVVLEHQDELVGMLVSAVTDVVTLEATQIEPPTPGLRTRIGMGIARTPGAPPTVLLDAQLVFE